MTIASLVQLDRRFLLVLLVLCGVFWWSYWTCTGINKNNKNKTTIYIYMYRCTKPHRQQIITNKQNNKMFGKWVHFWVLARNCGPLILLEPCGFCQDSARHFGPWILLELSTLFFVPVNVLCTPWKDKGPAFPLRPGFRLFQSLQGHTTWVFTVFCDCFLPKITLPTVPRSLMVSLLFHVTWGHSPPNL